MERKEQKFKNTKNSTKSGVNKMAKEKGQSESGGA